MSAVAHNCKAFHFAQTTPTLSAIIHCVGALAKLMPSNFLIGRLGPGKVLAQIRQAVEAVGALFWRLNLFVLQKAPELQQAQDA
jgi:hypothetical protein